MVLLLDWDLATPPLHFTEGVLVSERKQEVMKKINTVNKSYHIQFSCGKLIWFPEPMQRKGWPEIEQLKKNVDVTIAYTYTASLISKQRLYSICHFPLLTVFCRWTERFTAPRLFNLLYLDGLLLSDHLFLLSP